MSRTTLIMAVAIAGMAAALPARGIDPHLDPAQLPTGCPACHVGHGASRSPMLPGPQAEACMSCHGSATRRDAMIAQGHLASNARPRDISSVSAQPYVHPISTQAYSRHEPGVVTCTSCHSPHRAMNSRSIDLDKATGVQKLSTRGPSQMEYELCGNCHGGTDPTDRNPLAVTERLNPRNASHHAVEAPSRGSAPSIRSDLAGKAINCTDCHGNNDPNGVRGPHGSSVRFVLRSEYSQIDGDSESPSTYELCYQCHKRELVLSSSLFPEHRRHVVDHRVSCASCHDAHGSVENRALIRIGEQSTAIAASASTSTGILSFQSSIPGSGT